MATQPALPQNNHPPASPNHCINAFSVTLNVLLKFGEPLVSVASRYISQVAPIVSVPETAMDKNHHTVAWQANVRHTWQREVMQAIAKSPPMKEATHQHFWLRILPFDARHHAGSRLFIDYVRHTW